MFIILIRDPISGQGIQDNFATEDEVLTFITGQLSLWKIGKSRIPATGFQIQVTVEEP